MNIEDILIKIAVGIIIVFMGHLLMKEREKRNALRAAIKQFREAFAFENILFADDSTGISPRIDMGAYIAEAPIRHAEAIENFASLLSSRKQKAMKDTWNEYRSHTGNYYDIVSWFNANGTYKQNESTQDKRKRAFEIIKKILSFADD